jgi:hypothetical protein
VEEEDEDEVAGLGVVRLPPSVVVDEGITEGTSVVVLDVVWLSVVELVLVGDAEDSFLPGLFKGAVVVSKERGLFVLLSLLMSDVSAVLLLAGSSNELLASDAVLVATSSCLVSSNCSSDCSSQEPVLTFENTAVAVMSTCLISVKQTSGWVRWTSYAERKS